MFISLYRQRNEPFVKIHQGELITENVKSGTNIYIYTLDGYLQANILTTSDNQSIPFSFPKGVYLIVIEGYTYKVIR